jgi:inorganic pyrophosphatase
MDLFRKHCDGDPLDVLVLVNEPTFPGCVMEVKPIGVHMADDKGQMRKVICVPVSDPIWNSLNDLSDMNPHLLKEIEHFFKCIKILKTKS